MGITEQFVYELIGDDTKSQNSNSQKQGRKTENRQKRATLFRLLRMMKSGFWFYLIAIIVMSLSLSGFDMVVAYFLKDIIAMAQTGSYAGLGKMLGINLIEGIGMIGLYAVSFYIYTIQAKTGCANLQKTILNKAMVMPYDYYENTHSGDFMSKLMYDCGRTEDVYGSRFRRIVMPVLMVFFYLIPMFILSWQVTLCLLGVCIATFLINALFIKPMSNVSRRMSGTHTTLTERLSNILSGMEQIKIFNLNKVMVDSYVEENDRFRREQKSMNILSSFLEGINRGFDLVSSLVFIAIGIFFVSIHITTIENLAAIYVLYGTMNWNFMQIGIYIPSMASCLVNAQKVFAFLDSEEEPVRYENTEGASKEPSKEGFLVMEHVDFSYDGENQILSDFNLTINQGETVALKGESGKGKSTIAKILLGFYPIQKGNISLAGKGYQDMTLEEVRNQIGYVPQEPYLYDVSIAENIRYGRPDATREEIIAAAKAANAHDFIMRQEQGYDTNAGERGSHLSGGEKQRIAIARAVLKNAPVLILDEATSALDNESERLVNDALEKLMENRTTIMIAHRISTLERATRIVEI